MAIPFHLVFLLCLSGGMLLSGTGSVNSTTVPPLGDCAAGWTLFGNRCFIVQNGPSTFVDAQRDCFDLGGNLASIHDLFQNHRVRTLIRERFGRIVPAWIGLFNAVKEGRYKWTDGSPLDYQDWAPREPKQNGGEKCVSVSTDYGYPGWNDVSCARPLPYVCYSIRTLSPA